MKCRVVLVNVEGKLSLIRGAGKRLASCITAQGSETYF